MSEWNVDKSIIIPEREWKKIEDYTELCSVEVACMGYARLEGSNVVVDEVFLVPQVVSLHSVDFLEKGLPYAVDKAIADGRLDDLRFCWHSHATHPAFFSETDRDMVRKIRDSGPIPWFASAVLNKSGKTHGQIDWFAIEGPLGEFAKHVTVNLEVCAEGRIIDDEELRQKELEEFLIPLKELEGKAQAGKGTQKDGTSKHGEEDFSTEPLPAPRPTKRDWALHMKARKSKWDCYIADDVAYYWSEGQQFEGSAPLPIKHGTENERWTPVEETVLDARPIDGDEPELYLLDSGDDHMERLALERGQL